MTETRPDITTITTGKELRRWYWLKAELLVEAQRRDLPTSGSKQDLIDRIATYLDTGKVMRPAARGRARTGFNWARDPITPDTVIDAGYSNGPNVRDFFITEIGSRFRFNITFMDWMKANTGRAMSDAVTAWLAIETDRKAGKRQPIPASNQYNRYTRDFFDANPGASIEDARRCWKAKRAKPGHNRYEPQDLDILRSPGSAPQQQ
ncbi:MAG: DUF6434 domain-containing protein [Pseudomonadota bacterium]